MVSADLDLEKYIGLMRGPVANPHEVQQFLEWLELQAQVLLEAHNAAPFSVYQLNQLQTMSDILHSIKKELRVTKNDYDSANVG